MQAESVLLEPYYSFNLEVPTESVGRAMSDLQRMGADFNAPQTKTATSVISGVAPVSKIRDYHSDVISYTHGTGRLSCIFKGYDVCKEQDDIVKEIGYNADLDLENTPNSVFCAHGAGFTVRWDEVFDYMHLPLSKKSDEIEIPIATKEARKFVADEEELLRIFESTYGKIQRKTPKPMRTQKEIKVNYKAKPALKGPEYLLIDGYNIIFAWEELKKIAEENLEDARLLLISRICNYRAIKQNNVILVFDAYKVRGNKGEIEEVNGITVVYTKEAETADSYIEKTSKKLSKDYRVKVATSDNLEQIIIFGNGATRVSATEFLAEVKNAENEMRNFIEIYNKTN